MNKFAGTMSISAPSTYEGDRKIRLTFNDESSHIKFLVVELDPADFAMALTGLSEQKVSMEVRGLDLVGKTKETQTLQIILTENDLIRNKLSSYDKVALQEYLSKNQKLFVSDDWVLNCYLGSQTSICPHLNGVKLNVHKYRYV